jgi:hypothetical protein
MPLRPLDLSELYDTAVKTIQHNPRTMVGVAALMTTALSILTFVPDLLGLRYFVITPLNADAEDVDAGLLLPMSSLVLTWMAVALMIGVLVVAVNDTAFGREITPGQLWSRIRHRLPGILGLALITSLVPLTLLIVPLALGAGLFYLLLPIFPILAVPAGLALGALGPVAISVLITRWSLAFPVLLLENLGIRAALARSWNLVRGRSLRVFGILLLTLLIIEVVDSLLTLPFSLAGMIPLMIIDDPGDGLLLLAQFLITVGKVITGMLVHAFLAAVITLLYLDLRMRYEGLDVALMSTRQEAR